MPTVFSHVAVPLAAGLALGPRTVPRRLLLAGLLASVAPDLDVIAFRLGIAYADAFGHRGASHSLAFAVLAGALAMAAAPYLRAARMAAFLFVAFAALSHPLLDMLTNGGHGVALWWPASDQRVFFPWQVIEASPLSVKRLLGPRGLAVLQSELLWVWLPAAGGGSLLWLLRARASRSRNAGAAAAKRLQ